MEAGVRKRSKGGQCENGPKEKKCYDGDVPGHFLVCGEGGEKLVPNPGKLLMGAWGMSGQRALARLAPTRLGVPLQRETPTISSIQ